MKRYSYSKGKRLNRVRVRVPPTAEHEYEKAGIVDLRGQNNGGDWREVPFFKAYWRHLAAITTRRQDAANTTVTDRTVLRQSTRG
jgi:hypothetical protein